MDFLDILTSQLADPFRIGLLIALALTASNTAAVTGTYLPLLMGVVFVAVLIPMTLGAASPDKTTAIAIGLVSNAIILGLILAAIRVYRRLTR